MAININHSLDKIKSESDLILDAGAASNIDVSAKIVKNAAQLGCPVLVHAEDYESCGCGIKKAKEKNQDGLSAWSSSRSPEFEAKAIKTLSWYFTVSFLNRVKHRLFYKGVSYI